MNHRKIISVLKSNLAIIFIFLLTSCSNNSTEIKPSQSASKLFPHGVEFSNIKNIDDRSQAWAICTVLHRTMHPQIKKEERAAQLLENSKDFELVTMIVTSSDSDIEINSKRSALQSMLTAQKLFIATTKNFETDFVRFSEEMDGKALTRLLSELIGICDSNIPEAEKILKAFDSAKNTVGSKEHFLSLELP